MTDMNKVKLVLVSYKYLFFEKGTKGVVFHTSKRFSKANEVVVFIKDAQYLS